MSALDDDLKKMGKELDDQLSKLNNSLAGNLQKTMGSSQGRRTKVAGEESFCNASCECLYTCDRSPVGHFEPHHCPHCGRSWN